MCYILQLTYLGLDGLEILLALAHVGAEANNIEALFSSEKE